MRSFLGWLAALGAAGATRNAARSRAERRLVDQRVEALSDRHRVVSKAADWRPAS